jgi:hypothetical protein
MTSLPQQIRAAISAGDFTRAARLFEEHVFHLRVAVQARTCDSAAIEEARGLLLEAQAARASLHVRLQTAQNRAYVAGAYRSGNVLR